MDYVKALEIAISIIKFPEFSSSFNDDEKDEAVNLLSEILDDLKETQ